MKKYFLSAILLFSLALMIVNATLTFAATKSLINPFGDNTNMPQPVTEYSQLQTVAENVVRWLYTIFFILAVLFFLLAAYNYMRGGTLGEEYIKKAKSQLKYGIIAVIIAVIASGAAVLISTFLSAAVTK